MKLKLLTIIAFSLTIHANAQQHNTSKDYTPPTDPLVQKKLVQWQTEKFGLLMHWGTYSEWGVVESWSICPEDEGWCERKGPYKDNYFEYVKAYENLQKTFNPTEFNPQKWADAAKNAGMKYVVFTTKHHDGFNMFDTKYSDYKVTDPKDPFSANPKANIAKEVFSAFRNDNFMIGAYYSKPDWHSNDYWWRYFPPSSRNPSYNPKKYPEKWEAYKQFVYNQIGELTSDYGSIDILWLDGGWVRPKSTIDTSVDWQKSIPYDQDIDMPKIATMARKNQPGLLFVDRTVSGEYENYVTPEQSIPAHYLPYPWESCMTLGNSWSYVPNDTYKSANKVIHILTEVVSKNGNLLLNIGPSRKGDWDPNAYSRLKEIGKWLDINGNAIYNSVGDSTIGAQGKFVFTNKANTVFAIYRADENENKLPNEISIQNLTGKKIKSVKLLGASSKLKWKQDANSLQIAISDKLNQNLPCKEAWSFEIDY
ncbi:alpha-L-fucosidase [Rhizosphaericola mali]|uniref:alpha-L-fucosidase n=1 Tax=Rhizosphaericola mali TaxID=2545455 RepID=A0A5P2G2Y6_9BACT|nr:alpha-L-fucosidase [Rhizosphaericola mali]QES89567.1 alpha-L-fucosidase [Rhizosphaericola mali]